MRIGQDISIQTCRDEGYMVMDYRVYAFKKNPFTTDCTFTCSLPSYARSVGEAIIHIDVELNWKDLMELYEGEEQGIKDFTGMDYREITVPTPFDLLNLASDINSYCGLGE